jgi:hypothetical protein
MTATEVENFMAAHGWPDECSRRGSGCCPCFIWSSVEDNQRKTKTGDTFDANPMAYMCWLRRTKKIKHLSISNSLFIKKEAARVSPWWPVPLGRQVKPIVTMTCCCQAWATYCLCWSSTFAQLKRGEKRRGKREGKTEAFVHLYFLVFISGTKIK